MNRTRYLPLVTSLAALALLSACGDEGVPAYVSVESGELSSVRARAESARPAPDAAFAGEESAVAERRLVRRGQMTVRVDDIEPAVDRLHQLADQLAGYVGEVHVRSGEAEFRHATVQLRIAAARLDEAMAAVRALGTVESVSASSQDVTDQHVDLEARLNSARRLEQRLLVLLETRTGDLQQVLAAERELSRVRTEIERLDASLRRLEDQVAMSTLTVQLRERRAVLGVTGGPSVIGEAFRQAGRNFLRSVAGIITIAGGLVPVLLVLGLAAAPVVLWLRRRRRRPRPAGEEPAAPPS